MRPQFASVFEALAAHNLVLELHAKPLHIARATTIAERHPELRLMLDHAGKPPIASGDLAGWQRDVAAFASASPGYCKLSGLFTEADMTAELAPVGEAIDAIIDVFGVDRVVWGSDWPFLNLASDYRRWFAFARDHVASYGAAVAAQIFSTNARTFYGFD